MNALRLEIGLGSPGLRSAETYAGSMVRGRGGATVVLKDFFRLRKNEDGFLAMAGWMFSLLVMSTESLYACLCDLFAELAMMLASL